MTIKFSRRISIYIMRCKLLKKKEKKENVVKSAILQSDVKFRELEGETNLNRTGGFLGDGQQSLWSAIF